jgi:hypothetical protein
MRVTRFVAGMSLLFLTSLALWSGTSHSKTIPTAPSGGAVDCSSPGCKLDVILQGPLVIVELPGKIRVIEPKVAHHLPPRFGDWKQGFDPKPSAVTYVLQGFQSVSKAPKVVNPVGSSDIFTIDASTAKVAVADCSAGMFCIEMPTPDELIPWNADAMSFSASIGASPRYATSVMLRYTNTLIDPTKITISDGTNSFSPKLRHFLSESEFLLAILLRPEKGHHGHEDAIRSYRAMAHLFTPPLRASLTLPPASSHPTAMRNTPLDSDVMASDVDALIHLEEYTDLDGNDYLSAMLKSMGPSLFDLHSDCLAGMIRVTNAQ